MNDSQAADSKATTKSSKNLIRIVLIGVLLAVVAVKVFDISARSRAQRAYDIINTKLDEGQSFSDEDVHNMLGEPTKGHKPEPKKWIDTYSYRGAFYKYSVLVHYSDRAMKLVESVEIE